MKLSRTEYALLTWAESETREQLGRHTGGPYEQEYRAKLEKLRQVVLKLKPQPASRSRARRTQTLVCG